MSVIVYLLIYGFYCFVLLNYILIFTTVITVNLKSGYNYKKGDRFILSFPSNYTVCVEYLI